jgi:chorismate mutase / prephenate dehydratase
MTVPEQEKSLEEIRREIDAIDDGLLDLLIRRGAATRQVRETKRADGSIALSPLRPAREAIMLRRLIERGNGVVSAATLVRLWRVILSSSTQAQAPVTLHVDQRLNITLHLRLLLEAHFCGMDIESHPSLHAAFAALTARPGDLVIADAASNWAEAFTGSADGRAQLISALPVLARKTPPELLVFGHADPQPSGCDETVILSKSELPLADFPERRWSVKSGSWTVTSVPGFLLPDTAPPAGSNRQGDNPALNVAGRYPSPIEVVP